MIHKASQYSKIPNLESETTTTQSDTSKWNKEFFFADHYSKLAYKNHEQTKQLFFQNFQQGSQSAPNPKPQTPNPISQQKMLPESYFWLKNYQNHTLSVIFVLVYFYSTN